MMRIDVRDRERFLQGRARIELADHPAQAHLAGTDRRIDLQWGPTIVEDGVLTGCPVCGCREIFRRRDFPQRFGLILVIVAIIGSVVFFAMGEVIWSVSVLVAAVVVDRLTSLFTSECLVCYRCRSEFRGMPITDAHEPWDLAIGEKYRPVRQQDAENRPHSEGSTS